MAKAHPEMLQALTAGIQSEVAAYVFYYEALKKVDSDKIKDVLEKLALEEKDHFHTLERRYDSFVRSEKWNTTADVLRQPGLPPISEEMNETHRELIDEVAGTNSMKEVLDIAYRLEKESNELFADAAQKSQTAEARTMFEQLARFEEGHMNLIDEMRSELL
jgi:rubrerythrin